MRAALRRKNLISPIAQERFRSFCGNGEFYVTARDCFIQLEMEYNLPLQSITHGRG